MTQDEINQAEWADPDNWSDRIVGLYFSKRNTRTWVPKRIPWMGFTLNLAKPAGAWWLIGILLGVCLIPTLLLVAMTSGGQV